MKTGFGWFWIVLVVAAAACAAPRLSAQEPAPVAPTPMEPVTPETTEPQPAGPASAEPDAETAPAARPIEPIVDDDEPARPIPEVTSANPFGGTRPAAGRANASSGGVNAANPGTTRQAPPKLIREGKRLFERRGRVSRQGTDMVMLLDGEPQPLVLIRTKPLERIEDLSDFGRQSKQFVVSGQVSEYRGRNYLLLDSFRLPRAAEEREDAEQDEPPASPDIAKPEQGSATPEPPAPETRDRTAAPDAIERSIPAAPVIEEPPPSQPPQPAVSPTARPAGEPGPLLRQDKRLADREGRIVRQNRQTLFVFDSGDEPMVLLPNMKLQQMEDMSDFGRRAVRYRISGIVTEYRSRNYLMMSKMVIIPKETEKL